MATIENYSGNQFPYLLFGTNGTAGDLCYMSTGSGMTSKSNSNSGTENTSKFIGILDSSVTTGSYGAVGFNKVYELEKLASTNKIEAGDVIYADGAAKDNKVGTLAGGTAIGFCVAQSATSDTYVSVKIVPFFEMKGGFHA